MMSAADCFVFVGAYADGDRLGGIHTFALDEHEQTLRPLTHVSAPEQAGFLAIHPDEKTLYAVDERKTDGRGPVGDPAAVHTFVIRHDGALEHRRTTAVLGAFPTYLAAHPDGGTLVCVSHGGFDHVEVVRQDRDGNWGTSYIYDDSTVVLYRLDAAGRVDSIADVQVLNGHGPDPNGSPQAGGHAQASPHAHCAAIDPSGRFVLVADKGTDRVHTFGVRDVMHPICTIQLPATTGPRHAAFHPDGTSVFITFEFSSEVAAFDFDPVTGVLSLRTSTSTLGSHPGRVNEPADVQIHPNGRVLYVNNRGEDTLAWFEILPDGNLARRGSVPLAPSIHPGLAARSIALTPSGDSLLMADRPAGMVRMYRIEPDGSLQHLHDAPVPGAAFVTAVDRSRWNRAEQKGAS